MVIYPIRNDGDHKRALGRIETLMDAEALTAEDAAELDALVTLADAYEERHFSVGNASPTQVIAFLMDQRGLTRKDLEPMVGSRARVSEVLSGKRRLTLAMIQSLSSAWGISADLLISKVAETKSHRGGSRQVRSPQEKKDLSLHRDRRNSYGENDKSSRKNIPLSKRLSQRAARHASDAPLRKIVGEIEEDGAVEAELRSRTQGVAKDRRRFAKRRDKPLGEVLKRKAASSHNSWKAMGQYPPPNR